jgi:hypothetical protein
MGYYQVGGVRGDFYGGARGDPGFFSFLGKVAKGALGIASSFMPGGAVVGKVLGHLPGGEGGAVAGIVKKGVGVVARHPVLSAAGAAGVMSMGAGAVHEIRRGRAGRMAAVPGMRRHRRMRVTNPKALRRAIRRTQGFAKLAMRTIHLVHPKKHARFGGFKRRRRKAA